MGDDDLTAQIHAHMAELRAAFDLFDRNDDGLLDAEELALALQMMGLPADPHEVQQLLAYADPSGHGAIDFPAFVDVVEPATPMDDAEADLRQAFAVLDDDDDGYIDITELARAVRRTGAFDPAEAPHIVHAADMDGDGRMSFDEFRTWMRAAG